MSVFLDSNIVIYLIERTPHFGEAATRRVQEIIAQGQRMLVSDLVRMECYVRPLQLHDDVTLSAFNGYFDSEEVDVGSITAAVCNRAALIRAQCGFRPMDSLHLATAVESGCERFLTHDVRLRNFPDLVVEILE